MIWEGQGNFKSWGSKRYTGFILGRAVGKEGAWFHAVRGGHIRGSLPAIRLGLPQTFLDRTSNKTRFWMAVGTSRPARLRPKASVKAVKGIWNPIEASEARRSAG